MIVSWVAASAEMDRLKIWNDGPNTGYPKSAAVSKFIRRVEDYERIRCFYA